MEKRKCALVILDGWGIALDSEKSAIDQANTPFFDDLVAKYPNSTLKTYGKHVGLPEGQMGNSEVGHLNIGAGRIILQELARINHEVSNGDFFKNRVILEAIQYAKAQNKKFHIMGLVSDGGVHSSMIHLKAIIDLLANYPSVDTYIHAFLDGRDTSPTGGADYIQEVKTWLPDNVQIASVIGRYYAMDRDKRWERTKLAYELLTQGIADGQGDLLKMIEENYGKEITDEFMPPLRSDHYQNIKSGDVVFFFNFRTDRPRQLTTVLTQNDFPEHEMKTLDVHYLSMTQYDESYKGLHVVFNTDPISNTLGEWLSAKGISQVRAAETEKYPHVTFFFSGGLEEAFDNESRVLEPSPSVATYDLQPEMSASPLTEKLIESMVNDKPDFICINYANADMVGHTGIMSAAVKAVEHVDHCLELLVKKGIEQGYEFLIIADHGNADIMLNEDGSVHTAHTTNLVPCIYIPLGKNVENISDGLLCDIAPTILDILHLEKPDEMTGSSLI